jgi:hypothetical protein
VTIVTFALAILLCYCKEMNSYTRVLDYQVCYLARKVLLCYKTVVSVLKIKQEIVNLCFKEEGRARIHKRKRLALLLTNSYYSFKISRQT